MVYDFPHNDSVSYTVNGVNFSLPFGIKPLTGFYDWTFSRCHSSFTVEKNDIIYNPHKVPAELKAVPMGMELPKENENGGGEMGTAPSVIKPENLDHTVVLVVNDFE